MKTFSLKPKDISRVWYVLDASEVPLGRLSTTAASLLIGKGKPSVTAHVDNGDFVIIINTDKLVVTGNKLQGKKYYKHSGFPGGLRTRTLQEQMNLDSTKVIHDSVRGMLPVNKLRDGRLRRLKIYPGVDHQHHAQKPQVKSLKKEGK
jgi:large subunit ribosomal protein L13